MRPSTKDYTLTTLGVTADPSYSYIGRTAASSTLLLNQHTTVIIYFGDSLSSASDNVAYNPANNFMQDVSLDNGQLYTSQSPCMSGGGPGNDSTEGFWGHRLAQKLYETGKTGRIVTCCAGVNFTGTTLWVTTPYTTRINATWGRLNALDLLCADRVIILMTIGGVDQINAIPASTMKTNLDAIIAKIRVAGFLSIPIYIAGHSWGGGGTGGANGLAVRAGQVQAINQNASVFAGPDVDVIGLGERYDTNHYTSTGSDHAATLWYNVLQGIFP